MIIFYVFFIFIIFIYLLYLIKKVENVDNLFDLNLIKGNNGNSHCKFSILICAHNEESVIEKTLKQILGLAGNFEIVVVDDRSIDKTGKIVDEFIYFYNKEFDNKRDDISNVNYYREIKVLHRDKDSKPGKSASLNDGIKLCSGEYIVMLDADSFFSDKDDIIRISNFVSEFKPDAIQLRKISSNPNYNLISYLSSLELCLDSFMQKSRNAFGGAVELRGTGMVIKSDVLEYVGGFDEDSITDDLEMSSRLFFNGKKILFLEYPFVYEQTVFDLSSWWDQRFRWLEGSLKRYIKYSSLIMRRSFTRKPKADSVKSFCESKKSNLDFFLFFISEFLVPFFAILSIFEEIGLLILGKGNVIAFLIIFFSYSFLIFPVSIYFLKYYFKIGFFRRVLVSLFFSCYMLTWMFIMFFVFKRILFDKKPTMWVSPKRLGGV
jgi:1,2-diacylglycerol 3-beta-glucosyltransferase